MNIKIVSLLFLPLILYGCATMNVNECVAADWHGVGYEDGSRGYKASHFGRHRKACSKHGIAADFPTYKKGYDQGVRSYCTPERGFSLGKQNKARPQICPNDLIQSVYRGYDVGQDIYHEKKQLKDEIKKLNSAIEEAENYTAVLQDELKEHEQYLRLANIGLEDSEAKPTDLLIFYTQREQMRKLINEKILEIDVLETEKELYYQNIEEVKENIHYLERRPMPLLR